MAKAREAVQRAQAAAAAGHLWSHVWALADAARLGRHLGDPRQIAWQEEALATAQLCGMRALTSHLLLISGQQELPRRPPIFSRWCGEDTPCRHGLA